MESRRRMLGPQAHLPENGKDLSASSAAILYLYGTVGCHLCHEAKALVEGLPEVERWCLIERDIAGHDELYDRYGTRIPVLQRADDSRELDWPFETEQVRRLLVPRV